jgi:hypothetical protein
MEISKNEYFQFPSITSQFYNISALARPWFSFGSALVQLLLSRRNNCTH